MNGKEGNLSGSEKTDTIVKRILDKNSRLSIADLVRGKVKPYELQPLLMKAYENIVKGLSVKSIFNQYQNNLILKPCDVNQKELLLLDCLAYGIIPADFEAIELSPISPMGVNGILAQVSQKNILSTIRNVEVNADATTALALECASRKALSPQKGMGSGKEINLCASHRSIRLQKFPANSGFSPHFRVFAACTAARDTGDEIFESNNLKKHVDFYLNLLENLNQKDYQVSEINVCVSDIRITERIIELSDIDRKILMENTQTKGFKPFADHGVLLPETAVSIENLGIEIVKKYRIETFVEFLRHIQYQAINELQTRHPGVKFEVDLQRIAGIGYYNGLCFKITAKNKKGVRFPLADGGLTDWIQKILSSKKEKLFISGFGSELFCKNFKK